ncbi:hypothetical protein ACFVWN_20445 [Nocardiopsis flavescens]|uniref:hypothetical protein n=1 Tax=Nocardiopsis flavescens TaxID=758803 RepID=UPI00364C5F4C
MDVRTLHDRLQTMLTEGRGHWPVWLTCIDPENGGAVYRAVDVEIMVGDDGEVVGIDLTADMGDAGDGEP